MSKASRRFRPLGFKFGLFPDKESFFDPDPKDDHKSQPSRADEHPCVGIIEKKYPAQNDKAGAGRMGAFAIDTRSDNPLFRTGIRIESIPPIESTDKMVNQKNRQREDDPPMVETFFENYFRRNGIERQKHPDGNQTPQNQMSYYPTTVKHICTLRIACL